MKLSVSLPAEDLAFLDSYARARSIGSRSAVLHRAIRLLRAAEIAPGLRGGVGGVGGQR